MPPRPPPPPPPHHKKRKRNKERNREREKTEEEEDIHHISEACSFKKCFRLKRQKIRFTTNLRSIETEA